MAEGPRLDIFVLADSAPHSRDTRDNSEGHSPPSRAGSSGGAQTGAASTTSTATSPVASSLLVEAGQFARSSRARAYIVAAVIILVARQVLAAPIRAYLPGFVWYAPDALVAIAVVVALGIGLRERIAPVIAGLFLLACFAAISLLANPWDSVALSMRQFFYFGLAVMAGFSGAQGRQTATIALIGLGVLTIAGVAYDYAFGVPWKNMLFSGMLATKSVAREWWSSGGERRIAGFCLSSTDSSVAIACGMLLLAAMRESLARAIFWLLVGPAVWAMLATTQKATCAAFLVVLGVMLVTRAAQPGRYLITGARALRVLAITALIGCVIAPLVLYKTTMLVRLGISAPTFEQRFGEVWPTVIGVLTSSPQSLIGYGFGAAADTATDQRLMIVDNAFLFSTITVGLVATLAAFASIVRALARLRISDAEGFGALAIVTLLAINCITANVVMSGGLGSLYIGFAIGVITRPQRAVRARTPTLAAPSRTRQQREPDRSGLPQTRGKHSARQLAGPQLTPEAAQ